eukprot:6623880-Pyramimonas_sp.AAC.1
MDRSCSPTEVRSGPQSRSPQSCCTMGDELTASLVKPSPPMGLDEGERALGIESWGLQRCPGPTSQLKPPRRRNEGRDA